MEQNSLVPIDNGVLPLEKNPVSLYLASLTSGSRKTMGYSLKEIVRTITSGQSEDIYNFPFWSLELAHIQLLKNTLAETHSINTTNLYMSSLKGVLKNSWRLGLLSQEEYARKVDIQGVKGSDVHKGRSLAKQEISALLGACDSSLKGCRDRAIISILIFCGLRRSELAHLKFEDLSEIEYQGVLGYKISVSHGKGNKSREVWGNNLVYISIIEWIKFRGSESGYLFPRLSSLKSFDKPISSQTVYDTLRDLQIKSNINHFSPHDLRRTFVSTLLEQNFDLNTVSKLAGHQNVSTTTKYDKRSDNSLINASFGLTYTLDNDEKKV